MKKMLTLLLAIAMLCTGTSAFASGENEEVLKGESTARVSSDIDWSTWEFNSGYDNDIND